MSIGETKWMFIKNDLAEYTKTESVVILTRSIWLNRSIKIYDVTQSIA